MFRPVHRICWGLLVTAAASAAAFGQTSTCTFHKIQIKTDFTSVYGINNKNAIVGTYNPTSSSQAAFVLKSGVVSTIFYPGASMTSGFGINDNGDIVGAWVPPGFNAPNYGFQYVNGVFTSLSYPGSILTSATGINKNDIVVGSYQDTKGVFHGYVYSGGKYAAVNYPGQPSTVLSTINNNGVIAGGYTDTSNIEHGFVRVNGKYRTIDFPGAANTIISQVNDNGVVTGTFYDASYSTWQAFVWINGSFSQPISDPATPTQTAVNGINTSNVLVGNASYNYGFAATGCVP